MQYRRICAATCFLIGITNALFAHGGGIDAFGGHNDRKNGGYHFNHGPLAGKAFSSKFEAIGALQKASKASDESRSSSVASAASRANLAPPRTISEKGTSQKKSAVVYITRTGKKYHREGCSSLRLSAIEMNLSDAEDRGYTACLRCGGN